MPSLQTKLSLSRSYRAYGFQKNRNSHQLIYPFKRSLSFEASFTLHFISLKDHLKRSSKLKAAKGLV